MQEAPDQALFAFDVRILNPKPAQDPACSANASPLCNQDHRLHVRRPVQATYEACADSCLETVHDGGRKIVARLGPRAAQGTVFVPQWGAWEVIDLETGFAEKKAFGFAFDAFGRVTSYGWKGDSRAASATGAVAGATAELKGALSAAMYSEADAEIASLDKQVKYYQLQNLLKAEREKFLNSAAASGASEASE